MKTSVILYCIMHVGIVGMLFFNCIFRYIRMQSFQIQVGKTFKESVAMDGNKQRAWILFRKALMQFFVSSLVQLISFALLYKAGLFD